MTGKFERPESRNDRKAKTTGKLERPESQIDRKTNNHEIRNDRNDRQYIDGTMHAA